MSKYIDYEPIHIDEIDYSKCKYLINEVCCNDESECVADYPNIKCETKEECRYFAEEDGKIEEVI